MNLGILKTKALQHIAFLTGVPSTGTKSRILEQLHGSLQNARMPQSNTRILSVDMGIRNLAYCVIDVPADHHATNGKLQVQSWRRLDLVDKMRPEIAMSLSTSPSEEVTADKPDVVAQAILKNSFTPSVMSKVALQVAQDFLSHKPDIVLIERQRFRSGGGSAIQEWTVRVNTLESMLWACFETMKAMQARSDSGTSPAVHEVAPKRVASFWTASPDAHLPPADLFAPDFSPPELKATKSTKAANQGKKEKIAVLRSWLDGSGGVSLQFSPETQSIAAAFATGLSRRKTKSDGVSSAAPAIERETKLDDLADCVLQGAAWVWWEENRRAIAESIRRT